MADATEPQPFDVVIVGAGISGIDAAYHLRRDCPERSFVILDALEDFGGTWLTHRYPGVRSDTDLYTLGYSFKPWTGDPIASGDRIREYLAEVVEENDIGAHARFGRKVTDAAWSSDENRWTLRVRDLAGGPDEVYTCEFLWMCQGYYRHERGYTPSWPALETFKGLVVHPQTWPEGLDLTGLHVVVIGSGATAATLVPTIAPECAHVTMLQRSPTYFFSGENRDELADQLRALEVEESWIHEIVRRQRLSQLKLLADLSLSEPEFVAGELINAVRAQLPDGYDVATHFTPRYRPWQQRIAYLPEGDFFRAVASGRASVVTAEIEGFTPHGIRLTDGEELLADVVITATGFELCVLGDVRFSVDGRELVPGESITYRGMMLEGVPNMSWIFGYFRAAWTLRADLVCDLVCRILRHMRDHDLHRVVPTLRDEDQNEATLDWVDAEDFNPGYLTRSVQSMPRRLAKAEWSHSQDYWGEKDVLSRVEPTDGCLVYS